MLLLAYRVRVIVCDRAQNALLCVLGLAIAYAKQTHTAHSLGLSCRHFARSFAGQIEQQWHTNFFNLLVSRSHELHWRFVVEKPFKCTSYILQYIRSIRQARPWAPQLLCVRFQLIASSTHIVDCTIWQSQALRQHIRHTRWSSPRDSVLLLG